MVKEGTGFELDFTPETLPVLDHYLLELRADGPPDETTLGLVGPCAGAYFGEVIRRAFGGFRWHLVDGEYTKWRLEAIEVFLCFNPIGVALEAACGEGVRDWGARLRLLPEDEAEVERSLSAAGGVAERDYFRLAVRHEVIDQAMAVLYARREAERGDRAEGTVIGADVYAAVIDRVTNPVDS